jgi:hypothetical protein
MYRSFKEPRNISVINVNDESPFNYLVLANPNDSNCIYTLYNLYINSKKENLIRLMASDTLIQNSTSLNAGILEIIPKLDMNFIIEPLEIGFVNINKNICDRNYAILLPGGSLILEATSTVNELELNIDWSAEYF